MKIADIVAHMKRNLPLWSDKFSTEFMITAIGVSGSTVTITTSGAHGLSAGDEFVVAGVYTKTPIASLTRSGQIVTAVTGADHDLKMNNEMTVTVTGALQTDYNGTFALAGTINRRTFNYVVSGSPLTPASGTMYLIEDRIDGVNGSWTVEDVPSATSLTFDLGYTPQGTQFVTHGNARISTKPRIMGVIDFGKAEDIYTAQESGKYWAFVHMGPAQVSRSRTISNDAGNVIGAGVERRLITIRSLFIDVMAPTTTSQNGAEFRDDMEDVAVALYNTLYGWSPAQQLAGGINGNTPESLVPVSHDVLAYNDATLAYRFQYECMEFITQENSYIGASRAFLDIDFDIVDNDGDTLIGSDVDLDEDPL